MKIALVIIVTIGLLFGKTFGPGGGEEIYGDDNAGNFAHQSSGAILPQSIGRVEGKFDVVILPCAYSDIGNRFDVTTARDLVMNEGKSLWRVISGGKFWIEPDMTWGEWAEIGDSFGYMDGEHINFYKTFNDCLAAHPGSEIGVNGNRIVMILLNACLDDYAWGGIINSYRTIWIPPWAVNHGTLNHEIGHSLGLPHSMGVDGGNYTNRYDFMSYTWYRRTQNTIGINRYILEWDNGVKLNGRSAKLMENEYINLSGTLIERRCQQGIDQYIPVRTGEKCAFVVYKKSNLFQLIGDFYAGERWERFVFGYDGIIMMDPYMIDIPGIWK